MQDFQSIPGLAGRIFGGAAGAVDLRRGGRGYGVAVVGEAEAAGGAPVKCPRCESTNTKFCYYNNYNLSQPRHFCKSCRRYWTKGGVLRNVPVGGGCRKPKRSSSASSSSTSSKSTTTTTTSAAAAAGDVKNRRAAASASMSSSGSSSPTATASAAFQNPPALLNHANPNPDTLLAEPPPQAATFADPPAAAFSSLMAPPQPPPPLPAFGFSTAAGTEWPPTVDPAIFELVGGYTAIDPAAYWNPTSWADPDPSLYLP